MTGVARKGLHTVRALFGPPLGVKSEFQKHNLIFVVFGTFDSLDG